MTQQRFSKVAIVNRGEPAMRFITAAREWSFQHEHPLTTIALFTDPDRNAMFVREADVSYALGAPTYVDAEGNTKNSYLDYERLGKALEETGAEAVWVGWGFVAEHAEFADMCAKKGVVFIGPTGDMMRQLGDKITSKRAATEAEVPVAPWSEGPVDSIEEAERYARELGYPLMIKATAGGGGRGIRRVSNDGELADAFNTARSEAHKGFGDPTVFMERMVQGARHVEVQVIADQHGTAWGLGVRDCTIQRRNQKILEETPSPALTAEQQADIEAAAVRLVRRIGYVNAGTVEFLYDEASETFSFMEVNARLQVEHPVTEQITGADLVKLQIAVAQGEKLPTEPPEKHGHSIEVRLNAEDPERGFSPSPGRIQTLRFGTGPGIRVDTGVEEGDTVPAEFDSMIAKIIATGRTRDEAMGRLKRALLSTSAEIAGGSTNKGFLLGLLSRSEVLAGAYDVGWMDRLVAKDEHVCRDHGEIALLRAAIVRYDAHLDIERRRFFGAAARGRPEAEVEHGATVELGHLGRSYKLDVAQLAEDRYRVDVDGVAIDVRLERFQTDDERLHVGDRTYRVRWTDQGLATIVEVEGVPHRISSDDGGAVRVASPAVVVDVLVAPGDTIEAKAPIAIVEAMKMEMSITAPFGGRVREVHVMRNVQVPAGTVLVTLEPTGEAEAEHAARLDFSPLATALRDEVAELRAMMLGYDAKVSKPPVVETAREDEILDIFVDMLAVTRRASEAHLFSYLRDLNHRKSQLPSAFLEKLKRALAHYGIDGLERTDALEHALYRLFSARLSVDAFVAPVLRLLQGRLERGADTSDATRTRLERLVYETRESFPSIHDLARELHYAAFEMPLRERVAAMVYDGMAAVIGNEDMADAAKVEALVECPFPLKCFFARQHGTASDAQRRVMLEALTRRYYRIRTLEDASLIEEGDHRFFCARYEYEGANIQVLSTELRPNELAGIGPALVAASKVCGTERALAVDLYVDDEGQPEDPEAMSRKLVEILDGISFDRPVRRVVVAISSEECGLSISNVAHFTFRPDADGKFTEDRVYRGLHPMMSKRLSLWRLSNFDIERIESMEDVYLYRCVGKENPRDERLIALAEVRDVTPITNESGALIGLPVLERVLAEALAGIRRFQSTRTARSRLHWNRVVLFVWPPLDFTPEEINDLVYRMAPATANLGLERVLVQGRFRGEERVLDVSNPGGSGLQVTLRPVPDNPMEPLSRYTQNVVRLRSRGLTYPYEIVKMLAPPRDDLKQTLPPGEFVEHDLDDSGELVPVEREAGLNEANVVVGTITNFTSKYPEGMRRVVVLGDPSRGMGSLAEAECKRIMKAIDLAQAEKIPLEWFAVSAGARISMESGVENMDWIAAVLRHIVLFTQDSGEINIIVCGVNVGAQPYWNAEATMLMHARGILVMVKGSAMVLTGKQALDYSGSVSAEDNEGIGGYERIMGPNGQAQYAADDLAGACKILLAHYDHTYVAPGERFPRKAVTRDPIERDVGSSPHPRIEGATFDAIADVFSPTKNPGRKKPFDIRAVMRATADQDHDVLERWGAMRDADTAVVWDAHLGGHPVCLLGMESHPVPRFGAVPADGPGVWTSGTLFPSSSKKVARAINAASGNRPVVMLANLSGFDGSPESMRSWQLEYGAEIGRAVVNFDGPFVFCVVSRYHGGAFVVFSNKLNPNLEVSALEGTFASVIGGAPAAAVVFAREVKKRTNDDPRIAELPAGERDTAEGRKLMKVVRTDKLREVAAEFDGVHSVHRAQKVGAVHEIIPPNELRPYLIAAVERGIKRALG